MAAVGRHGSKRAAVEADVLRGAEDLPCAGASFAALAFALVSMVERSFHEHAVQEGPVDLDELVEAPSAIFTRTLYGQP